MADRTYVPPSMEKLAELHIFCRHCNHTVALTPDQLLEPSGPAHRYEETNDGRLLVLHCPRCGGAVERKR